MNTLWKRLALAGTVALIACGDEDEPGFFETSREYRLALFETEEECLAAQPPGGFFNCYRSVHFEPDGSVVLLLTDIQNPGRYEIRGDDEVVLRFEPAQSTETGQRYTFEMGDAEANVLIDPAGNEWELVGLDPAQ